MGDSGSKPGSVGGSAFYAAAAACLLTTYFALLLFAGWTMLQYGTRTVEYGWQAQRLGDTWFVSSVSGPAEGVLQTGDVLIALNSDDLTGATSLAIPMRSVASGSLYSLRISRAGALRDVFLRASTKTGTAFFRERAPILFSSFLFFCAALGLLLCWNLPAARLGFAASIIAALRMGAWALMPLSVFFEPQEFKTYFLFWIPAGLALPLGFHSLLLFPQRHLEPWRWVAGVLYGLWAATVVPFLLDGAVPAPVPEGIALIHWNRIEFVYPRPALIILGPAFVGVAVLLSCIWLGKLLAALPRGEARNRLLWLLLSGVFLAVPAAYFEIARWAGSGSGEAVSWSWGAALVAVCYSYVIAAEHILSPGLVLRSVISLFVPRAAFDRLDARFWPEAFATESALRRLVRDLSSCSVSSKLSPLVADGIASAFGPVHHRLDPEAPDDEILVLGPKPANESYTRRELRLLREVRSAFSAARNRIADTTPKPAAPSLNLLRECPACGSCYDSDTIRCPHDGKVPALTLPIERTIEGKYQLDRLIGRGGMGAVYAARDLRLNRRIAVKVMLSELFGHEPALRRFEREAQTAARLNHPNIIQAYDFGPIGVMGAFLVMEYAEGRTLREELQSGPLPLPETRSLVRQLLEAMEVAHERGVVHRDLKPENLLLVDSPGALPQLKILDFGLAKTQLLQYSAEDKLSLGVNTIGTVGYVPPEQLNGGFIDQRSDIFAIGRIVIEMLSGELPESGPGSVPEPARDVLFRATSPARDARPESIAALQRQLLPALDLLCARASEIPAH